MDELLRLCRLVEWQSAWLLAELTTLNTKLAEAAEVWEGLR